MLFWRTISYKETCKDSQKDLVMKIMVPVKILVTNTLLLGAYSALGTEQSSLLT